MNIIEIVERTKPENKQEKLLIRVISNKGIRYEHVVCTSQKKEVPQFTIFMPYEVSAGLDPAKPLPPTLGEACELVDVITANGETITAVDRTLPYSLSGRWLKLRLDRTTHQLLKELELTVMRPGESEHRITFIQKAIEGERKERQKTTQKNRMYFDGDSSIFGCQSINVEYVYPIDEPIEDRVGGFLQHIKHELYEGYTLLHLEPIFDRDNEELRELTYYKGYYDNWSTLDEELQKKYLNGKEIVYIAKNGFVFLPYVDQRLWTRGNEEVGFLVIAIPISSAENPLYILWNPQAAFIMSKKEASMPEEGIYQRVYSWTEEKIKMRCERWVKITKGPFSEKTETSFTVEIPIGQETFSCDLIERLGYQVDQEQQHIVDNCFKKSTIIGFSKYDWSDVIHD